MKSIATIEGRDEILDRFSRLTHESRGLWGKMDVNQMVCHCADQVRICLGTKPARKKGNFLTRTVIKFVALNFPISMPKNMRTIYELDPGKAGMTRPAGFQEDRHQLTGLIGHFFSLPGSQRFSHPVFGGLSKQELGKLTYLHLDHHLQQFGV